MKKMICETFALQIIRMFAAIPRTTKAQVLGKQLLRSGTSVGANCREAYRGRSKAEWSERGASDMHGNGARVAESEAGAERMNLSRSAAIPSANSKRLVTGLNCSWTQKLSQQKNFQLFDMNATN